MLKVAIIGVGSLGKMHLKNVIKLQNEGKKIKLVALCDVAKNRFYEEIETNLSIDNSPIDLSEYNLYTDAKELLQKEELDFVITAVPTYIHKEIAVLALEKGVHVFSEKPMAINLDHCQTMIDKAKETNKLLMIGQCLRFWPEYVKLKEYIDSKVYGNVVRAEFKRYSPTPTWSWQNWLLDVEKSGCAALDMHVHDVDYINYVFGTPPSLTSVATHKETEFDSILTTYHYDDMLVTSACDWGFPSSYKFNATFLVRFEKATVEKTSNGFNIYHNDGTTSHPELDKKSAYLAETEYFIDCILNNKKVDIIPLESVYNSTKLALAEMESAKKNVTVKV